MSPLYRSAWHHFKHVRDKHGFKGFYRATPAVCIGNFSDAYNSNAHVNTGSVREGIYFVVYEQLKHCLVPHIDLLPNGAAILIASGIAKFASVTIFYPIEVTRTRLDEDGSKRYSKHDCLHDQLSLICCPDRFVQALSEVWKGKCFYSGFRFQLLKTVPHTMIAFYMYEYLKTMHSD